jgi:hypothetical protein
VRRGCVDDIRWIERDLRIRIGFETRLSPAVIAFPVVPKAYVEEARDVELEGRTHDDYLLARSRSVVPSNDQREGQPLSKTYDSLRLSHLAAVQAAVDDDKR